MLKARLLLIGLVFLVYAPVFFNDFAGDDHVLFVNNSFYKHPSNVVRLFDPGYNVRGDEMIYGSAEDKGAGSVAYRPVVSLSFFADAWAWKQDPRGYHLTSLLLHVAAVLMLFRIGQAFLDPRAAFVAALLFGIHQTATETVVVASYRSDLLCGFFLLAGFLLWMIFKKGHSRAAQMGAYTAYFLALFSKETALLFPLTVVCMDLYKGGTGSVKVRWAEYMPFLGIALFYLYVYFFVFPNTVLEGAGYIAHGLADGISVYAQIIGLYLKQIFMPFSAGTMPGLYCPSPQALFSPAIFLPGVLGLLAAGVLWFVPRKDGRLAWASLWVIVFLLPALVPTGNPNPVAMRYLYIPSAGLMLLLAAALVHLWDVSQGKFSSFIRASVAVALFLSLAVSSALSIMVWKNNFSVGNAWIRYYPDHYMGYGIRGVSYFALNRYQEAARDLGMSIKDPRCGNMNFYFQFGVACIKLKRFEEAHAVFEKMMSREPFLDSGYRGMGSYYYFKKEYALGLPYFERAFFLFQNYHNAANWIKALAAVERHEEIALVLKKVEQAWGKGEALDEIDRLARRLLKQDAAHPSESDLVK